MDCNRRYISAHRSVFHKILTTNKHFVSISDDIMSVDLSLIIPNKCQSLRDTENAKKCFDDTINHVIKHFHGRKQFVTEICIRSNEDDPEDIEYSFEIPILNITAYMHAGYWDIWPVARYSQYFFHFGTDLLGKPRIWPRNVCFNTLLAFGHTEGWVCDEFHSWNSRLEDLDTTFEDWKLYGEDTEDRTIYEFDIMQFADVIPGVKWPDYKRKYHDEYKECHAVLRAIRNKFPNFDILSIEDPLPTHALVAKDDDLFILNYETGICLTNSSIDNCRANFNGAGIQVFKGEKSAFFNMAGKQLTQFRVGDFSWKWGPHGTDNFEQIIIDNVIGENFLTDGTTYGNS